MKIQTKANISGVAVAIAVVAAVVFIVVGGIKLSEVSLEESRGQAVARHFTIVPSEPQMYHGDPAVLVKVGLKCRALFVGHNRVSSDIGAKLVVYLNDPKHMPLATMFDPTPEKVAAASWFIQC